MVSYTSAKLHIYKFICIVFSTRCMLFRNNECTLTIIKHTQTSFFNSVSIIFDDDYAMVSGNLKIIIAL